MNYENVLTAFFLAMAATVIIQYLVVYKFLRILKERYRDIWFSLDSPSLFVGNTRTSFQRKINFIAKREYEKLGDLGLERVVFALRVIFFVGMTILACGLALTVVYLRIACLTSSKTP